MSPGSQVDRKRHILRETLRRIGKIVWDREIVAHTGSPWNYRNQARFKVACQPGGRTALGFFEAGSHRLLPVEACLILSPLLNRLLGELRREEWGVHLAHMSEIELLADDRDERVMMTLRGALRQEEAALFAQACMARLPGVSTVAVERGREFQILGKPALSYQVGEFRYRISPGSFFQGSRFLLQEFVEKVIEGVSGALALDLFAGIGLLTLPLARRFIQVIGVEAIPASASDLAANARCHGLTNVQEEPKAVFDFLRRFARAEPDLVVLDPPREGVGARTLRFLVNLWPRNIHYASCSPPTLARDLGYLVSRGYRLNSVEFFDFFPQTYHLECLARLTPSRRTTT